jgi:hypothetical protein
VASPKGEATFAGGCFGGCWFGATSPFVLGLGARSISYWKSVPDQSALEFPAAEKRHDVSIRMNAGVLGSSSPIVAYFSASLSVNSLVLCRGNE